MLNRFVLVLVALLLSLPATSQSTYQVALLPPADQEMGVNGQISAALNKNQQITTINIAMGDLEDLGENALLPDLLVLSDASALPSESMPAIQRYLRNGGDIIALRAPLWQTPLLRDGAQWVSRTEYAERNASALMEHVLFDFATEDLANWSRSTNAPERETQYRVEADSGIPGGQALHVFVPELDNWETFRRAGLQSPFPEGDTLTVFYAKGGPKTTSLAVEWTEKDGSRWMATVSLTSEWTQFVLAPEDFHYWESIPGRAGDAFHPENADQFTVGLAMSHGAVGGKEQSYWLGPVGTAPRTNRHEKLLTSFKAPAFDILSPGYKFFPAREATRLAARPGQSFFPAAAFPVPGVLRAVHPRPGAGGFDKGRDWRWTPLLEAFGSEEEYRGATAALLLHADGPCKGGVWASFGIEDPAWYTQEAFLEGLGTLVESMRSGLFLLDGGADHYTYFEDQPMRLGARVANLSKEARANTTVRLTVKTLEGDRVLHEETLALPAIAPGAIETVESPYRPAEWPLRVCVDLLRGDALVDHAEHEAHVWRPESRPSYVTVRDGEFQLDGARWRPHGVNYMPSSGIGTEDQPYFEYWIDARPYDPEIIQRDLDRIAGLGMNAISVFIYHRSLPAQNLLDLLRRADALGLKVNLSLRPGTPMDFHWDEMRELITCYRLAEHDCVFAYDLAWEPMWGNQDVRKAWDADWQAWIEERYGGLAQAEADWDYAVPRDASGAVTNPTGEQLITDGPWVRMIAAYRRFADTLLYEKFSQARRFVRANSIRIIW